MPDTTAKKSYLVAMADDDNTAQDTASKLFIVGVGASAGGLEALGALLKNVQVDSMAFVVVQHLAPQHESVLPELLGRVSNLQVRPAEDGMKVEANQVYVIPPNAELAILQGVLHVMPPAVARGMRLPIDYFFRSLADDQGSRSIGIVLSGTGSDGTFGLKAIKAAGGITFAQDPATAKYDGMPRNAIDAGWVDSFLPPDQIAEELATISRHPYLAQPRGPSPQHQESFSKLVLMMRNAFSNDLTYYKPSTLDRRTERRMALHKIERFEDYLRLIEDDPDEQRRLYKDMLISVTAFFRDHDPYDAVKTKILPRLMDHKQQGSQIRIWVPACATGEEAYSLAICLLEYLEDRAQDYRIQIFGTDVDEASIQHARRGIYPQNIALDVSPERLHRFFVKKDDEFQVCRRIRDMVVFSVQNITRDAPFSRLDLVSCRNLLIYLQPAAQKKVLNILHYALAPTGYLMLGTSETVGDSSDLFSLVDRTNKLYAKKHVASVAAFDLGYGAHVPEVLVPPRSYRPSINVASLADRKLLEIYAPPGVVINQDLEVLHFRGQTGPYLEPAPGAASLNILRLARQELHVDLRRAVHEAQTTRQPVSVESSLTHEGKLTRVRIEVFTIPDPETNSSCLLVLFRELDQVPVDLPPLTGPAADAAEIQAQRVADLERDLMVTKEYLQSTVEELESSNEELKSSNEELQSSNEELQSTNEELETSKDELQSANEELTTVNDELQSRMGELQQSNDDLHNVLSGIGNAVVIIGMDLRIRRYTHMAEKLINMVAGDLGRSVSLLNAFVKGQRVEELAKEVIERLVPVQTEVRCSDDRRYMLHITPYRTLDHAINGAVIVLVDIEARKRSTELDRSVAEYANAFLGVIDHPLMIIDRKLRVLWLNERFQKTFQVFAVEETLRAVDATLLALIEAAAQAGTAFRQFPAHIGEKKVLVSGSRIPPMSEESTLILLSFEEGS